MINKVFIQGRLTKNPEVIQTQSGTKVANFSVAYNRPYKDKDGNWQEETSFFDVKAFNGLTEKVSKLQKGDMILIEGRLVQERWEKDGKSASKIRIIAERIQLLKRVSKTEPEVEPQDLDELLTPEQKDDDLEDLL